MQDPWSLLMDELVGRGWTCRGRELVAPHEAITLAAVEDCPDLASLRGRMARAAAHVEPQIPGCPEARELHAALDTLVDALDVVIGKLIAFAEQLETLERAVAREAAEQQPAYALAN